MADPQQPVEDPQKNIETQPISLPERSDGAEELAEGVRTHIEDVVQRRDVENAQVGDIFVSGSGTKREVLEKTGPTNFKFKTTKEYVGSTAVDWSFRLEPQGANMRLSQFKELPVGTVIYGPEDGNPPMVLEEVKKQGDTVYGISASFQEDIFIDPDTMGQWLVAIIKRAK